MAKEKIDVLRLFLWVRPYYRVIAHLDIRVGLVTVLVDGCQNLSLRPGVLVESVPLLTRQIEMRRQVAEDGMLSVFNINFAVNLCCHIVFPADASEEIREPGPHRVAVKFSQQGGMVKSDPRAFAIIDIVFKDRFGLIRPAIERIVELNEQFVLN